MDIIGLIQQKYDGCCQLCEPLSEEMRTEAEDILPKELLEILKISNGIKETMRLPDTGEVEAIESIIYSLEEIRSETEFYMSEYGGEGVVFAGDGAGGVYIMKPSGQIYHHEYSDLPEEHCADSLWDYFASV